jgi:DNA-binding protein HU-beta
MNKTDLITAISDSNNISKAAAHRVISSFLETVSATLAEGGKVTISGFGSFSVVKRSSRTGRNPKNGQKLPIPARNVIRFKTGKHLNKIIR